MMIRRRDSKTGGKKERVVRRLSAEEISSGAWARSQSGSAHHFFIDGTSVCGRPRGMGRDESLTRVLCPECYASAGRALSHE